jgi:hypothetical protein
MLAIQSSAMIRLQRGVSSLFAKVFNSTPDSAHLGLTIALWVALDLPVRVVLLRVEGDVIDEFSRFSGVRCRVGRFSGDERRVKSKEFDGERDVRCGRVKGLESNRSFSFIGVGEVGLRGRKLFIVKIKNRTSSGTTEA